MKDQILSVWNKKKEQLIRDWRQYKKRKQSPLPRVTHPYEEGIRRRQKKILLSFFIPFVFLSVYLFLFLQYKREQYQIIDVYVLSRDIKAPVIITSDMLQRASFPQKNIPEGAFIHRADILGKSFVRNKYKKEIIHRNDISAETNPESVSAQFSELFALSVDESWFESKFPNIKVHDRIDVMAVNPIGDGVGASVILEYTEVVDIRTVAGTRTLTLNITQSQAQSLLFARGLRVPLQILVYPGGYQVSEPNIIPNSVTDENSSSSES